MSSRLISPKEVTDQEVHQLVEPAALAIIILSCIFVAVGYSGVSSPAIGFLIIALGILGVIYAFLILYVIIPSQEQLGQYKFPNLVLTTAALILAMYLLSGMMRIIPLIIMILVSLITFVLWDRRITYAYLTVSALGCFLIMVAKITVIEIVIQAGFFLLAIIFVETVERLYASNQKRVLRLQAINDFSRSVSVSLDMSEVVAAIGKAIKNALQADTYFYGLMEGDNLKMELIVDDGEFYPSESVPLEGSLSGWVIRNKRSLFIPDLRNDVDLEGVKVVIMGKDKASLCWMGVPLLARHINGVIVVASYQPDDFNRTDLELLENLAQQAALVLDNAHHHAEVEAQSQLDSLTGVFNHGHIVKVLNDQAQACLSKSQPLSLIMLDIDFFKQYNDNYGHMVGDQVLIALNQAIRQHIKSTDAIGRWGGEEFTIVLPGTSGLQAQQVASRVQETVCSLTLHDRDGKLLPFPTVSQGLAVYPDEAADVYKLIDLADQRLYTAKLRGRNQIEPKLDDWDYKE